jgi:hypothetical protein
VNTLDQFVLGRSQHRASGPSSQSRDSTSPHETARCHG